MLRTRIEPNLETLDILNQFYYWIPDSKSIRPKPQDLENKFLLSKQIESNWVGWKDYILHNIFGYKYDLNSDGKKFISSSNNNVLTCNNWIFSPSVFRYNISNPETNHWILWNKEKNFYYDYPDELINQIIEEKITKHLGDNASCSSFEFVWYKNPKPTILEFYHVQVFWISNLPSSIDTMR